MARTVEMADGGLFLLLLPLLLLLLHRAAQEPGKQLPPRSVDTGTQTYKKINSHEHNTIWHAEHSKAENGGRPRGTCIRRKGHEQAPWRCTFFSFLSLRPSLSLPSLSFFRLRLGCSASPSSGSITRPLMRSCRNKKM